MKKSKETVSYWKAKCWDLFSDVIRMRDCLQTMHRPDWGMCCTCGVIKHITDLQAGHFIPGRHNLILFDLRGCHAQCYRCNIPLKGNPRKYHKFMLEKYGQEVIDELDRSDGESKQFKVWMLKELYDQFTVIKRALEYEATT